MIEPGSEKSSENLSSKSDLPLAMASEGESLRIVSLRGGRGFHEKLVSMGFTKGTDFVITRVAPMGDPVEINVRGFALTLRKDEAAAVTVERGNQP